MNLELIGFFSFLFVIGLCIGSFLNVVIYRLPVMLERAWKTAGADALSLEIPVNPESELTLVRPRSRCSVCGHQIRWYENIPLLSYLYLRGRCSSCGSSISVRYPVIELFTGLLFVGVGLHFDMRPETVLWCGFVATLIALAAIDWDTTLLPDCLTIPLLWAGLIVSQLGYSVSISESIWGATLGYLCLWSIYWVFKLFTGKEGMGYGDFKLLAALGAWLGVSMILPVVMLSSFIGAIIGLGMKFTGSLREGHYIPFGPFLVGAGLVILFMGNERVLMLLRWA